MTQLLDFIAYEYICITYVCKSYYDVCVQVVPGIQSEGEYMAPQEGGKRLRDQTSSPLLFLYFKEKAHLNHLKC